MHIIVCDIRLRAETEELPRRYDTWPYRMNSSPQKRGLSDNEVGGPPSKRATARGKNDRSPSFESYPGSAATIETS